MFFSMSPWNSHPTPLDKRGGSRLDRLLPDLFDYDWATLDPTVDRFLSYVTKEYDDHYDIALDVPGFNKDNLKITIDQGVLQIEGETEQRKYSRAITLPRTLDWTHAESKCKDGVLTISIYKSEKSLPKKIVVTDG